MLAKMPSVIRNNQFDARGLAVTPEGLLVPAYVGSELGFNEPGRFYLDNIFYPELIRRGILPLCPFKACLEYMDFPRLDEAESLEERTQIQEEFNSYIGAVNYETLMPRSKLMIALLEGHRVDEGLSAEIAYFVKNHGPVVGIRSDFRLCENPSAPINLALRYFLDKGPYNAAFFVGEDSYKKGLEHLEILAKKIKD